MYARNRGTSPMTRNMGAGRRMPPSPDRQPAYRQKVRVPPNYSGNAVVDDGERLDLTAAVSPPHPVDPVDRPTTSPGGSVGGNTATPEPRFDDLPRVSDLGGTPTPRWSPPENWRGADDEDDDDRLPPDTYHDGGDDDMTGAYASPAYDDPDWGDRSGDDRGLPSVAAARSGDSAYQAASSPTGRLSLLDPSHFPFGHGLGFDELFLLGLIFFLLMENDDQGTKGDLDETVLLLGLLLFCE